MRREGHGEQWRDRSIVNPTEIHIASHSETDGDDDILKTSKALQFDEDDLDFLFYHKAPTGYMTSSDEQGADGNGDLIESEDERTVIQSLQYWFDTYSTRKYWDSFAHSNGNVIFSEVMLLKIRLVFESQQ